MYCFHSLSKYDSCTCKAVCYAVSEGKQKTIQLVPLPVSVSINLKAFKQKRFSCRYNVAKRCSENHEEARVANPGFFMISSFSFYSFRLLFQKDRRRLFMMFRLSSLFLRHWRHKKHQAIPVKYCPAGSVWHLLLFQPPGDQPGPLHVPAMGKPSGQMPAPPQGLLFRPLL